MAKRSAPKTTAPKVAARAPDAAPPLALASPAALVACVVAAACIALATTYRIVDTDFWQHLAVGRAIWQTHSLPHTNVWTWPTFGAPYVLPSWLYRAVLWPFWRLGGIGGLFLWRWLTTAAAFALLWATARRMGARGLTPLVALVWWAMIYRQRAQLRPETLVSVLMAAQLWLLETPRQGGRDRTPWVIAIAWLWANAHVSYPLGLAVTAFYALDERWRRPPPPPHPHAGTRRGPLLGVLAASCAVSFLHPYGWRALWQPFEFALFQRHEPIFRTIVELLPIDWALNVRNGLPVLLALLVALALWRWRRHGFDRVEALILVTFLPQAFVSQRFLGLLAIAIAPFFARDLDAWVRAHRWPRWTRPAWNRAALASAVCLALTSVEVIGSSLPFGIGIDWTCYPVRASDYLETHEIRGRGFNAFHYGGYLLWRFWPERGRLPFMDVHQTGTREDRDLYTFARLRSVAWRELDRRHRFDWVLVPHDQYPGQHLLDFLDADTTWSLVFIDDAGAVYLRRDGRFGALAARDRYRLLPASVGGLGAVGVRVAHSAAAYDSLRRELVRARDASPWSAYPSNVLANLAMMNGRWADAERELVRAATIAPETPLVHERLGRVRLGQGRPREALAEYERERPRDASIWLGIGRAHRALGERTAARDAYQRALQLDPGFAPARDSLAELGD